jgi:hypothetical protein
MLKIPDDGCAMQPKAISLWEGTIQLNLSSLIMLIKSSPVVVALKQDFFGNL